jgi:hypothetical protein
VERGSRKFCVTFYVLKKKHVSFWHASHRVAYGDWGAVKDAVLFFFHCLVSLSPVSLSAVSLWPPGVNFRREARG